MRFPLLKDFLFQGLDGPRHFMEAFIPDSLQLVEALPDNGRTARIVLTPGQPVEVTHLSDAQIFSFFVVSRAAPAQALAQEPMGRFDVAAQLLVGHLAPWQTQLRVIFPQVIPESAEAVSIDQAVENVTDPYLSFRTRHGHSP
jgi:hypothetical protein